MKYKSTSQSDKDESLKKFYFGRIAISVNDFKWKYKSAPANYSSNEPKEKKIAKLGNSSVNR